MINYNMSKFDIELLGRHGANNSNRAMVLNSFYLYTDKNEQSVGQWLSQTGYWESWITSWMTKNIKQGNVCIDIGSNYGYYTLLMQSLVGKDGGVYSFEANPELCDLVAKSIAEAPEDYGQAVLYNVAVWNEKTELELDIPSKYIGASTLVYGSDLPSNIDAAEWDNKITVKADKIDNIIDPQKIDLIKIDIEGAEPQAWEGMKEILKHTDIVIIEIGRWSPQEFLDKIYDEWDVTYVTESAEEQPLYRDVVPNLPDLVMAVLRKKNA